jgi:hypothetical protein
MAIGCMKATTAKIIIIGEAMQWLEILVQDNQLELS